MFDWKGLMKKEITLPIDIAGDIKYFIYNQYTIKETLELHYSDYNPAEWLFQFLNNHAKSEDDKISEHLFKQLPVQELYKKVLSTLCKGFYSFDRKEKANKGDSYPVGAYISFVCKELSLSPLELIENYTFEQLNYLTEGIIRNKNEQTEEGQDRNKNKRLAKEINEVGRDNIDKVLEKLRNKHKKDLSNKS